MLKLKFFKIWGLLVMLAMFCVLGFTYNIPIGLKHFINLLRQPADLYEPILVEDFSFKGKNYTKIYKLKPKYSDIYELGLVDEKEKIPTSFKFNGIIEVRLYYKNKLIFNRIISKTASHTYSKENLGYFKKVIFTTFSMPIKGADKNNISLKITVIKPDDSICQFVKLYVAVSDLP